MTDFASTITHTTRPGESAARCGGTGEVVPWELVVDHEHPATFTCGACLKDASGGVEPMGGSLYLEAAHR